MYVENVMICYRSSCPKVSCKKTVLNQFAKLTAKHWCQDFASSKVVSLQPATFLTQEPWHECVPMSFSKFIALLSMLEDHDCKC